MIVLPNEEEKRTWRELCWQAAGYTPTVGEFPVHGIEGELITTSYGQREVMDATERLLLMAGGVRAGKSKTLSMKAIEETLIKDGLMWIVGPNYIDATAEWGYLFEPIHKLGFIEHYTAPERGPRMFKTAWGFRVETKSSDDLTALSSFAPHVLLGVEMGRQAEGAFDKLAERAMEHNARVMMSGTFEGALSWYPQKWARWQAPNVEGGRSFSLPSWSNHFLFPGGRTDPKIIDLEDALNDPELFLERVGAVPYKPQGLVFRIFNTKQHVQALDFDPKLPVELAIDPGTRAYVVLAIQREPMPASAGMVKHFKSGLLVPKTRVKVIDEVYALEAIAEEVIERCAARPWFKAVKGGVIDVAGRQRQQGAKSQVQVWLDEVGIPLRANYVPIAESIATIRRRLRPDPVAKVPLLLFSNRLSDRVVGGRAMGTIAEMGLYQWRDYNEGSSESNTPIDANNHGLKALGYYLFDQFGPVLERRRPGKKKIRSYA